MYLLTRNKKMRASSGAPIYNFGIPAYKAKSGRLTCPNASHCVKGCYARQGAYVWSNVRQAFERRLHVTRDPLFTTVLIHEIKKRKITRVRIHDSGDFYSPQYLKKWISIANALPNVQFYAYTKMISLVKSAQLPDNFTIIFSYGGKEDHLIDPINDRHSKVFSSNAELQAQGYVDASHDDTLSCGENKRIGLVYHGAKSKNWAQSE